MRIGIRTAVLFVVTAVSGAGCITGRAATPTERPALEVPPPPSRTIPQVPAPDAPPHIEPVEELPLAKPPSPQRNTRPATPKDTAKPDPKTETPPADPPAPAPPQPATPPLRMPPTGDANATARAITDIIERTRRVLGNIDYGRLSTERKKVYDDSKLFAQQAEDAVKVANLVFARELADKAERLAKELQK